MKHLFTPLFGALAFMALPIISLASVQVDGISYELDKATSTATVVSGEEQYTGDITIPDAIVYEDATYQVTAIGDCAFLQCTKLTSMTIGDNVKRVGFSAFERCFNMAVLILGESVEVLDRESFKNCKSLEILIMPSSMKIIGDEAFRGCEKLIYVDTGDAEIYVGRHSFEGCGLFSLIIPESVEEIRSAFLNESKIKQVIALNETPLAVKEDTFEGINQPARNLYVPAGSVEAYKAADYWKEFGIINPIVEGAIYGNIQNGICYNLYPESKSAEVVGVVNASTVEIPEEVICEDDAYQVSTICKYAFAGCTNVEYVTIPATIGYIGEYAFKGCTGLKEIYNYSPANYTELTAFEGSNYQNATVYVQENVLDLYKATKPWADFKEVLPFTTTGISEISISNQSSEYFDTYGRRIESLQKGINIIKVGNETKKVIVK